MKGIVFTEFLEMVESQHGADQCDAILDSAASTTGGAYTSVGTYAAAELVRLVEEFAKQTAQTPREVLFHFGTYLFGRFVQVFPHFFEGSSSAFDILLRVEDIIHPEVLKLYPDAELPRFQSNLRTPDQLEMTYNSPRKLEDFAHGLIHGCGLYYEQSLEIDRQSLGDVTLFNIRANEGCGKKTA